MFYSGAVPDEKFPVMVWFHPGDFQWGASSYWDATTLAAKYKVCIRTKKKQCKYGTRSIWKQNELYRIKGQIFFFFAISVAEPNFGVGFKQ